MYLSIDDSDSKEKGCTTFLALSLLDFFYKKNLVLASFPSLVRLNPNIPEKTRGNAAIGLHLQKKEKASFPTELIGKKNFEHYLYKNTAPFLPSRKLFRELTLFCLKKTSSPEIGFILFKKKKRSKREYLRGVWSYFSKEKALKKIKQDKNVLFHYGQQGLIGAYLSSFWPEKKSSFELLSYRLKKNIGTKRSFDLQNLRVLSKEKGLFKFFDEEYNQQLIFPNTPCPVLFGIQFFTWSSKILPFSKEIKTEPFSSFLSFKTNQGSKDQEQTEKKRFKKYSTYVIECFFLRILKILQGGHVLFEVSFRKRKLKLICFEKTKKLRSVLMLLLPGDFISLCFSYLTKKAFNLEWLCLQKLVLKKELNRPRCCKKNMTSKGKNAPLRCKKCRTCKSKEYFLKKRPLLENSFFYPPLRARRHLS